jgi:hypothetical protein
LSTIVLPAARHGAIADLVGLSGELRDDPGEVVEVLGRARSEPAHLGDRHADVEDLERDELAGRVADRGRDPAEDSGALGRPEARPGALVEGPASGFHGEVDVGGEPLRDLGERLVRRGIEGLERPPVDTRLELAGDVVQLRPDLDPGGGPHRSVGRLAHPRPGVTAPARSRAGRRRRGWPRCARGSRASAA